MKIAIVSAYFLESTMALVRHLGQRVEIDLYCVFHQHNKNGFVIDLTDLITKNGFADNMMKHAVFGAELAEFFPEKVKSDIFMFSSLSHRNFLDIWLVFKLVKHIKNKNYDVVHVIGQHYLLSFLHKLLKPLPRVHSLHETYSHLNDNANDVNYKLLNYLADENIELIFHSKSTLHRFTDRHKINKTRVNLINYSLFETYKCFEKNDTPEHENTILYFGIIRNYKGIEYLIEAGKIVAEKLPDVKIIIAGRGEPYFGIDTIKDDKHFEFINKPLSNYEIVEYVKKTNIVVCPYISASQSGVPMVSYLFNKPIIASDVGGLSEVIDHKKTGLLVPPRDAEALAEAITEMLTNVQLLREIKFNIATKYSHNSISSWSNIAEQTIEVYRKSLQVVS